ncbi:bifunctional diaminohydroxyphosphoribosylaminopyrimidine deaminase/5-amino-6-(5-phosphoribosylamino)uracil reductase RibD [Devosia sp.]|uniref:bifunctional diaminohydroxyphosphoribosylaminopyrimidine deaminase/5-amino-6-(5-phosphoribosylamino)uracil reductase RibD n=1 Tax=Devosia sp. TaxID=1871048 RepID=UPI002FCC5880
MTELAPEDKRWLDAAVRYATPFLGTTADGPTVAALVVDPRSQTLLSRAVTAKGGRPHAEAQAIAAAGFEAAGCTLYVTLEPCHHWGRTPPCVDAIIRAGIMRVVIGAADPDPRIAGSIAQLESAGVETVVAQHAPSFALHAGHILRHTAGRPFVTAVLAVSADGMIGRGQGRVHIAGPVAGRWIDVQRARANAVLVGAATARNDDPALTVTLPGLATRTPLRVVLAGSSGVDRRMNLIGRFSGYRTAVIAETSAAVDAPVSVETIRVTGSDGRPDLGAALAALGQKGIQNLLVEPGQRLLAGLLEADLVDRFALILAPLSVGENGVPASPDGLIADLLAAAGLVEMGRQRLGGDTLALYERPSRPD